VKVTDRRTAEDFATCMRELTDVHFPAAERIRVVLDNLSTHSAGALYQAFPASESRRVLRRLEFHYVPKHASWLNMVEIEIGVLRGQCLDRRIATQERLVSEIAAWERQRNASGARINPRSQPGNDSAMPPGPASNGCSQPRKPAPKWAAPTQSRRLSASSKPKSHNRCAEVLVGYLTWAAINRSNAFIAQLGRFIPARLDAKVEAAYSQQPPVKYRTIEEVDADLREMGWTDEKIQLLVEDLRK
jgi:hypothetical protein